MTSTRIQKRDTRAAKQQPIDPLAFDLLAWRSRTAWQPIDQLDADPTTALMRAVLAADPVAVEQLEVRLASNPEALDALDDVCGLRASPIDVERLALSPATLEARARATMTTLDLATLDRLAIVLGSLGLAEATSTALDEERRKSAEQQVRELFVRAYAERGSRGNALTLDAFRLLSRLFSEPIIAGATLAELDAASGETWGVPKIKRTRAGQRMNTIMLEMGFGDELWKIPRSKVKRGPRNAPTKRDQAKLQRRIKTFEALAADAFPPLPSVTDDEHRQQLADVTSTGNENDVYVWKQASTPAKRAAIAARCADENARARGRRR